MLETANISCMTQSENNMYFDTIQIMRLSKSCIVCIVLSPFKQKVVKKEITKPRFTIAFRYGDTRRSVRWSLCTLKYTAFKIS